MYTIYENIVDVVKNNLIQKKKLLPLLVLCQLYFPSSGFFFAAFQPFGRYAKQKHKKILVDLKGNLPFKRHGFSINGDTNWHKSPKPMGATA